VVEEERIPMGTRIRDAVQGPDGAAYALTAEGNGEILRLTLENSPKRGSSRKIGLERTLAAPPASSAMPAGAEGTTSTITASSHKPLIALPGATGFIGQHLLRELPKRGYRLRVLLRRPSAAPINCASALIGDLLRPHNMSEALAEVDAVIHTAGVAQT